MSAGIPHSEKPACRTLASSAPHRPALLYPCPHHKVLMHYIRSPIPHRLSPPIEKLPTYIPPRIQPHAHLRPPHLTSGPGPSLIPKHQPHKPLQAPNSHDTICAPQTTNSHRPTTISPAPLSFPSQPILPHPAHTSPSPSRFKASALTPCPFYLTATPP